MRIILMSDPHLGKFWKINNSVSDRADKLYNYFLYNLKLNAKKDNALIIAGDVFDSIHANVEMLIKFRKGLDDVLSEYGKIKIIAGNHETFIDKNGNQQSLLELGLSNTENVVSSGVSNYIIDDINFILVPFQRNYNQVILDEVPKYYIKDLINIIVGHETPKDIFPYGKFSLNDVLFRDEFKDINIPFCIFGHYHKPAFAQAGDSNIISIGNSYYLTIDDIRDSLKKDLIKRYIIITSIEDGNQILKDNKKLGCKRILNTTKLSFISMPYVLPNIYKFEIENQEDFENKIPNIRDIKQKDINAIFWFESKVLVDYSQMMFEGCDIYFDLIKNKGTTLLPLDEIQLEMDKTENLNNKSKSLHDKWEAFLKNSSLTLNQQKLASYLFDKRDDTDITPDKIIDKLFDN